MLRKPGVAGRAYGLCDEAQQQGKHSVAYIRSQRQCFCDSWPWPLPFWPHNKWVPGLIAERFYVKFGDPSCIVFLDIVRINRKNQRWSKDYRRDCRQCGQHFGSEAVCSGWCSRASEHWQIVTSMFRYGAHLHRVDGRSRRRFNDFLRANNSPCIINVRRVGQCAMTSGHGQLVSIDVAAVYRQLVVVDAQRLGRRERRHCHGRPTDGQSSSQSLVPERHGDEGRRERCGVEWRATRWRGQSSTWTTAQQRVTERATVAARHDVVQDWIHSRTHVVQHSCTHTWLRRLTTTHCTSQFIH